MNDAATTAMPELPESIAEMGWTVISNGNDHHVMPVGEDHIFSNCPCRPIEDIEDDAVIIHNSFDGREAFERCERKTS